jgi:hypothetical protein
LLKSLFGAKSIICTTLLPWEVDAFRAAPAFNVRQYALPITHVITFNPLSERIISAQMRRALSFASESRGILKSIVLRDQSMRYGRPTSAPWHLASYATNPLERPPEFNLRLAYALRYAAERQLQLAEITKLEAEAKAKAKEAGEKFESEEWRQKRQRGLFKLPRLRMVVDPDPTAAEAAARIVVYWQRIGFEVDIIPGRSKGQAVAAMQTGICVIVVRMEEPLLELWALLTNDTSFDMNRLKLFPDWMRQELGESGLSMQVSQMLRIACLQFIDTWRLRRLSFRFGKSMNSLSGRNRSSELPEHPMSPYQNVERWIVRP